MRRTWGWLAAAVVVCGGCAGTAETEQAVAANEEDLVCERVTRTGSRIGRKVCMTQAQWDAAREGSRAASGSAVEDIQRRATQVGAPPGGGP
jgi:hypothetical protein